MDAFKEAQARIDLLFAAPGAPRRGADGPDAVAAPSAALDRVLRQAKRGVEDPDSLSRAEMREICSALVVHYAQMGIG